MVNFSEVVALSRDAHLRQAERERGDRAFVEDVMQAVGDQVAAEGGEVTAQGEWSRLSENATNTFAIRFPAGCNVEEIGLTVAGRVRPKQNVFMVGPANGSPEAENVRDREEAVNMVMAYLMQVVMEVRQLHER